MIRDCISYVQQKNSSLAIVKIDQKKAFDRVYWSFMDKVLSKMCLSLSFRKLLSTVHCKVFSLSHLHKSKRITLERGYNKSPLLFTIVPETLGCAIRANINKIGIPVPGRGSVKISQYAHDTTLLLKTESSVVAALQTVELSEKGSGSKINYAPGKLLGKWISNNVHPKKGTIPTVILISWALRLDPILRGLIHGTGK